MDRPHQLRETPGHTGLFPTSPCQPVSAKCGRDLKSLNLRLRWAPGALPGSAQGRGPLRSPAGPRGSPAPAQWHRRQPLCIQGDTPLRHSPRPRPPVRPAAQPHRREGRALRTRQGESSLGLTALPPGAPRHTPFPFPAAPTPHAQGVPKGQPCCGPGTAIPYFVPTAPRRESCPGSPPRPSRSARGATEVPSPGSAPRTAPPGAFRRPGPSAAPRWDQAPAPCHQPGHRAPRGRGGDAPGLRREVQIRPPPLGAHVLASRRSFCFALAGPCPVT